MRLQEIGFVKNELDEKIKRISDLENSNSILKDENR